VVVTVALFLQIDQASNKHRVPLQLYVGVCKFAT